jgi:uncharacterized membrane protein
MRIKKTLMLAALSVGVGITIAAVLTGRTRIINRHALRWRR